MTNLNKYKAMNPNDVRKILNAFFPSNLSFVNSLNINDGVVDIVWIMVTESKECTKSLNLVPRPSGSIPGIAYIVLQLGLLSKRLTKDKNLVSETCKGMAKYNFSTSLTMASRGI